MGQPPENKPGNPERLGYLLQRRRASGGCTVFCGVIEAYARGSPGVSGARRLGLGIDDHDPSAAALEVTSSSGRKDVIFVSRSTDRVYSCEDSSRFAGRFAMVCRQTDGSLRVVGVGAERVEAAEGMLSIGCACYRGRIVDFDRSETGRSWLTLRGNLPTRSDLLGTQLRVHTDGERDGCYTIRGLEEAEPGVVRVDLGDTSLVRGLLSPEDYSAGYVYNVETGQEVEVHTVVDVTIREGGCEATRASTSWTWRSA